MGPEVQFCDDLHAMKYRQDGETFRDSVNRVARALADLDSAKHYHGLRDALLTMRFLPAGRIQSAMGANRDVTAFNCFVSGTIPDSYTQRDNPENSSIMDRAWEAAQTMRMGGGIGYDFSTLRPRGDMIRKLQSRSSGPISFMHIFDAVCKATSSAGHRRGAQMGVLRVDHPDIMEFVGAKHDQHTLSGFNVSVAVTDEFMEAVARGSDFTLRWGGQNYQTVDARELWETIMRSTWDWAEPGVLFIDTINRMNNLWYCEKIAATNPCFTGDTKVWTDRGHKRFDELVGTVANVLTQDWDGKLVYRPMSDIRITQRKAKLVQVKMTDGQIVRCTPDHMFFLRAGGQLEASRLQPGMSLQSVYRYKANQKGYLRLSNGLHTPLEHHVPFEGGVDANYHVHHINGVKHDNRPENLTLMLASEHNSSHMVGDLNPMRRFPERNASRGVQKFDGDNPNWRSDISTQELIEDREAGMSLKAIAEKHKCSKYLVVMRTAIANHTVESVTTLEYEEDVYCGSVDEFHRFFVALGDNDGVLVHNCGEQTLPPFGACLLGSFNLVQYLAPMSPTNSGRQWAFDWAQLEEDIPHVVRGIDNVIDRSRYPLPQQQSEALSKRRMGLGVTGLANAAETMGMSYGSPDFLEFEERVLATICRHSYRASAFLAKEKGSFPLYDAERYLASQFIQTLDDETRELIEKHGIRNSHLTSIAPTGTISMTADNVSSSIEPVFSLETQRPVNTPDGPVIVTLKDYAYDRFGTRAKVSADVTAKEHVAVLTTAARLVDSAVSKTVNCDGTMPWTDFVDIYKMAWEQGAKGCSTFNADGRRFALLTGKTERTPEQETVTPEVVGESCTIDLATGRKSCE